MKLLHTSDWHIGRFLNQRSLLPDQEGMVSDFLVHLNAHRPDVLIIAGDLFDRSIPPKEALALVDDALSTIVLDMGVPTLIIGGNHDGGQRLAFGSGILKKRGLYIAGQYTGTPTPIRLMDNDGPVDFYLVPFIKPVEYRNLMGIDTPMDYDDMYAHMLAQLAPTLDPSARKVLITHGMVLSHAPDEDVLDDSVRPIEIGGISYARAERFSDYHYVALGHLHRPQKVGSDAIRYAGSPLKYSFSEVKQKKSITEVDLAADGSVTITPFALPIHRDMRLISGELDELLTNAPTDASREDYIKVRLTDTERRLNPMERLKKVYPNVLEMEYATKQVRGESHKTARIKAHLSDPLALFADFYESIHQTPLSDEKRAVVADILAEDDHATH